ncbi:MAG: ABC transporter ATP-binding protein [Sarcina sp.]
MLEIKNLKKFYETKNGKYVALDNVSFKVNKGEFIAVMGPSGSGKTTLLNCISGFIGSNSGEILLGKQNLLNVDEDTLAEIRQNKLGFVFQDFMLINGLTVKENVFLPQIIANKEIAAMESKTDKLLGAFGISEIKEKYPNEISGGQKQRVAVARALSNEPLILLADEPTGNLDSKSSVSVIESFIDAKRDLGATIFMVTHDAFAASYSDKVIALKDGKIAKELVKGEGSSREFLDRILTFMKGINGDGYDAK